jgi:tetratricopeptide (TPR) repeat protein
MTFFRRMTGWLRQSNQRTAQSAIVALNNKLESARRAQYIEQYDKALELLAEAMILAEQHRHSTLKVDITLSRADVLIALEDYEAAQAILNTLFDECETKQLCAPLAYTLASLGIIEQKCGKFDAARTFYEKARATADQIQTDGASGRATAHLGDIYLLEGNASYAIYLLEDALPRLLRSGDKELLGYFQGRLGDALIASGQPQEGLVVLQRGLEAAFALKHQPQVRELSQKLGTYSLQLADYDKAIQYLHDALRLYDKHSLSLEYTRLLCQLSRACFYAGKARESLEYAKQASEQAENISDGKLKAMTKAALGLALSATGSNQEALPHLHEAEQAYAALAVDAFYMDILRNLAQAQSITGDVEGAKATYHRAIEKGTSLTLQVAQVYTDLAELVIQQGDYKSALHYHTAAVQHYTEGNHRNFAARSHCALGEIYLRMGDGKMARRAYEQALIQLNNMNDMTTRGYVLALVANAYTEFGDMESADAFYKEAIEIARRDGAKQDEAIRRSDYGRFLALTNNAKRALTEISQAQKRLDELGLTFESGIQAGYLGLAYAALNEHDKTLENYEIALSKLEGKPQVAVVRANRADTYTALARWDEAHSDYEAALKLAQRDHNQVVIVQTLIGLAHLDMEQNRLDSAENRLNEAATNIRHSSLRRLQAQLYMVQSRLYTAKGETLQAQSAWEEAAKLRSILRMPELEPDWL